MDPDDSEQHSPRAGRHLLLIVASLLPFIAATSFLWLRSADAEPASDQDAADVARIVCRRGTTVVETPTVRAQRDGVHLLVESDVEGLKLSVNDGGWELGWEPARGDQMYPFSTTQWLPPGVVEVQCGTMKVADGVAFEVLDPEGLWHEGLACIDSGDFDERGSFPFYADVNPMPEAIARAIPGVRPTDVIDYYGYPRPPWEQASESYRIVRHGTVVGSTEISAYDDRTFAYGVYSCDDSGVGVTGEPTAGQLATPFTLPGLLRCDPYISDCSSAYLTATRYAAMRGEDAERYAVPEMPWAACLDTQPEGCPPDPNDVVLQILLAPRDAEPFVSEQGCGASETAACR